MPEHVDITDPEIHEPKGVAAAAANHVYISDGAGSGTWTPWPTGWGFYKDNAGTQVFNTTAAKLSIDGAGSSTDVSHLPPEIRGSGNLWDTTNDDLTPIAEKDAYEIRLDLPITGKTGSPNYLIMEMDISSTGTPSNVIVEQYLGVSGISSGTVSVGFPVYVGSTFIANGAQFFLKTDIGTVTLTNPGIFINRLTSGGI